MKTTTIMRVKRQGREIQVPLKKLAPTNFFHENLHNFLEIRWTRPPISCPATAPVPHLPGTLQKHNEIIDILKAAAAQLASKKFAPTIFFS